MKAHVLTLLGDHQGKVRDTYDLGEKLVIVTTDRQSAFDRLLASIPFKGQVLNQTSAWWFQNTEHIVSNGLISVPDPNISIMEKVDVFPVEFVVRGYMTGVGMSQDILFFKTNTCPYFRTPPGSKR